MKKPQTIAQLARSYDAHMKAFVAGEPPPGWLTVKDMKCFFKYINNSAASSKAKNLWCKGLMHRVPYQVLGINGVQSWAYCYKPKAPSVTLADVVKADREAGQDKVPKGWVSATQFIKISKISRSAVFQMAERHSIEVRSYRIRNGLCGLKPVSHFKLTTLMRLHHINKANYYAAG